MNILYFHDRLLRDIYRCAQVRNRLQHYIQTNKVDMILVSTHNRLKGGVKSTDFLSMRKEVVLYDTQDKLPLEGVKLYEDSLIIQNTVFKPVDGTVFLISTEPELNSTVIFMDFFADERFEDYHSDLSDEQLGDLQVEIKKKSKYN
jgi:hypothetical protein